MSITPTIFRFKVLADLDTVSVKLLDIGKHIPIWLFQGHMGAGKTTLIKSLCKNLNVISVVHSPTFALVNEYVTANKEIIYHFDFYRIKDEMEALDIGVEEYFDSGNFCLVEWAEKIEPLWPQQYLLLNLHIEENGERILRVEEIGRLNNK